MAKEKKAKKAKEKGKGIVAEFKAFISRGNVLDMAVGVIIGGAFSAIVTAVVNILLSVCTWPLPGGIAGLVTILPALNGAQEGVAGIGQSFAAADIADAVAKYGTSVNVVVDDSNYMATQTALLGLYTKHGGTYVFNGAAIIDWGTLINAVISFLVIALVLFIVVKTVNTLRKASDDLKAKAQEAYWEKHPEERPAPVDPGKPEPTDHELLKEMLKIMKENSAKKE